MFKKTAKSIIIIFIILFIKSNIMTLSLRPISLNEFVNKTELAVWGTLIKAEQTTAGHALTFRIDQTLKGQKLKEVTLISGTRYDSISLLLGTMVFLALHKNVENQWQQLMFRGVWTVEYYHKSDLKQGFYALNIPRGLINGFPPSLKEKAEISHLLPNGKRISVEIDYYCYIKMKDYLKTVFK